MSYLASELINRAWYLSSIIARDMETVPGSYTTEGLFLLNTLLDFKASDLMLIPYWKKDDLTLNQGQEVYELDDVYAIETMTYNIGAVRYPMTEVNRDTYYGSGRVNNTQSIPTTYHLERRKGGSDLSVYFIPNQEYEAQIIAKFALTDVTLFDDMSDTYDQFYLEYLRYSLARMMCNEWDIEFSQSKTEMLVSYEKKLRAVSPPDLTMEKVSFISSGKGYNWAEINIGKGYTP